MPNTELPLPLIIAFRAWLSLIAFSISFISGHFFDETSSRTLYIREEIFSILPEKSALERAVLLTQEEYQNMQDELRETVSSVYNDSLNNLKGVING